MPAPRGPGEAAAEVPNLAASSTDGRTTALEGLPVPARAKLAAAWTSFMFLYVYVDILGISQAWAIGALTLVAIPILVVGPVDDVAPRANRVTNLVVASVYVLIPAGNVLDEAWTYHFGLAVGLEVPVLALILRSAWTWPPRLPPRGLRACPGEVGRPGAGHRWVHGRVSRPARRRLRRR